MNKRMVVSERNGSESKNKFRIISIIIAMAMAVGALGALMGPLSMNASASITGDTYGGSGNFIVTQETVYDGTNLHVYGNIYINGGSLTIRQATLTMDESSQYQHNIYVNWSEGDRALKLKYATLTVSNSTDNGTPMVKVLPSASCNVYISFSTVNHAWIQTSPGTNTWLDNSTMHASRFYGVYDQGSGSTNITGSIFRDYAGWGLITSSLAGTIVTTNSFVNITQTEDPAYAYRAMITIYGDGTTGNVSILKNHFDVVDINAIKVRDSWSVRISRNHIDLLRSTAQGTSQSEGITAWADGKHASLTAWSYVDDNVIERCEANIDHEATAGISVGQSAAHWYVEGNEIWTVHKPNNTVKNGPMSTAIGASGTLLYIWHNHIGNVTAVGPEYDTVGGQTHGIAISGSGSISGPFTTTYVYVQHNTIDLVSNSSVGIEIRYMCRYIEVSNNTIGLVRGYDSSGIGVYNEPKNVLIADNDLTMWRDVWGINLAHNHTYATVVRNTIYVLAQDHFFNEGVQACVRGGGAIAVDDENGAIYLALELHWTAIGDVYANNTITQESYSEYFPEYTILNCSHQITIGAPGDWPKIILNQEAMIYSWHSNFSVRGPASELPVIMRADALTGVTISGDEWYRDFRDTEDFYFTNASLTSLGAATDDDVIITVESYTPLADTIISWSENSTANATIDFTLSGLENFTTYDVSLDGDMWRTVVSDGNGTITFSYSGTAGEHEFSVGLSYLAQLTNLIWPLVSIGIIFMVLSAVLGLVIGSTGGKSKK